MIQMKGRGSSGSRKDNRRGGVEGRSGRRAQEPAENRKVTMMNRRLVVAIVENCRDAMSQGGK